MINSSIVKILVYEPFSTLAPLLYFFSFVGYSVPLSLYIVFLASHCQVISVTGFTLHVILRWTNKEGLPKNAMKHNSVNGYLEDENFATKVPESYASRVCTIIDTVNYI